MTEHTSNDVAKTRQVWRPEAIFVPACRRCGAPGAYQYDDKTWPIHFVPGKQGTPVGPKCLSCGAMMGRPISYGKVPLGGWRPFAVWTRIAHFFRWHWADYLRRREVRKRLWT